MKDIGSKIIDQLSTDVYTGPGAIVRELVKNAYDAYLALDPDELEESRAERQVVISAERDKKRIGRILIADRGIGQVLEDLKANVQISVSKKEAEIENATGFRGLGSWATLGAGSKITITSTKVNVPQEFRLTIDVRKVYKILGHKTTLDDILNESTCITFGQRPCARKDHHTTVEIECDGPPSSIGGHELNRLYDYTDPTDDFEMLKALLIRHCPLPFLGDGEIHERINELYPKVGYTPTPIIFGSTPLVRRLPQNLTTFYTEHLYIGSEVVAIAWVVEDPNKTGEISTIDDEHMLVCPSIQLVKRNVPIGDKGIFGDNVRANILNWYIGEVHVIGKDVQPDAGGQNLRAGTARDAFIEKLKEFYKRLEKKAEDKSERLSLIRAMQQGIEASKAIKKNTILPEGKKQLELAKIAKAVDAIEKTASKRGKASTVAEQRTREAAADPRVVSKRAEARETLKNEGYLHLYSEKKEASKSTKRSSEKNGDRVSTKAGQTKPAQAFDPAEFQARVGRIVPQLKDIGLSQKQIEEVMKIIGDLFMS